MTLSRRDNNWRPALWSDLFDSNWMVRPNATAPAINVLETPEEFRVEIAAPGMKREDFNIEINEEHDLVITMERHQEEEQHDNEQSRYHVASSPTASSRRPSSCQTMSTRSASRLAWPTASSPSRSPRSAKRSSRRLVALSLSSNSVTPLDQSHRL